MESAAPPQPAAVRDAHGGGEQFLFCQPDPDAGAPGPGDPRPFPVRDLQRRLRRSKTRSVDIRGRPPPTGNGTARVVCRGQRRVRHHRRAAGGYLSRCIQSPQGNPRHGGRACRHHLVEPASCPARLGIAGLRVRHYGGGEHCRQEEQAWSKPTAQGVAMDCEVGRGPGRRTRRTGTPAWTGGRP